MNQGLSVIITVRGEERMLDQTIQNVLAKAGCPIEVIVVYDGEHEHLTEIADQVFMHRQVRGVGPSRHKGIKHAKYPVVFLTDAHMNFSSGFGISVLKHFSNEANAKDITCGVSYGVDESLTLMRGEKGRTACRFVDLSKEPGGEVWVMSGKWAEQEPGPIGCVYGACYGFKRSWYKEIGEPLELLRGWWGDEEYLSLASHLAGGRCVLLDYKAGHLFRKEPVYNADREDVIRRVLNRHRLIDLIPCTKKKRDFYESRFALNPTTMMGEYPARKAEDDARPEVIAAKKLWKSWYRRYPSLKKWTDASAAKLPGTLKLVAGGMVQPVSRSQTRKSFVCPGCAAPDTFKVRTTRRVNGEKRQYGRCCGCNLPGVLVKRGGDERILWGSDAD